MTPHHVRTLRDELLTQLGIREVERESIRTRPMSGVERLRLSDGRTVIFKFSQGPLTDEHLILRHVSTHGLPVPRLLAATTVYEVQARADSLGMLLEDLGKPSREPAMNDAAAAAVAIHRVPKLGGRPGVDSATLAGLPTRALRRLSLLQRDGRWRDHLIVRQLETLADIALSRCHGAEIRPFGMCHAEFNPASVHIGADGDWRVLGMARSYIGPGVLDLASWQGTALGPDIDALHRLLAAYVDVGGAPTVLADRSGLPSERWAIGWHRTLMISRCLEDAVRWIPEPEHDEVAVHAVRRHLTDATEMLGVRRSR